MMGRVLRIVSVVAAILPGLALPSLADVLTITYMDGTQQAVPLDRSSSSIAGLTFSHGGRSKTGRSLNLAAGKPAQQSSTDYGGDAGRAADGNTDGNYWNNSVSHTGNQPQAWWQVDLGDVQEIDTIRLWNRTDCCSERTDDFYVLVSSKPFPAGDPKALSGQSGVWSRYFDQTAGTPTEIPVQARGRYVRVQLAGSNWLHLAEVEVFGR